jgi:hypothetical protein
MIAARHVTVGGWLAEAVGYHGDITYVLTAAEVTTLAFVAAFYFGRTWSAAAVGY